MNPLALASVAGSLLGNIAGLIMGKHQQKLDNRDLNNLGVKTIDPNAISQLAMAKNLYGGRMAGAANAEANIYQNQANAVETVQNNATDGSQALAVDAGLQGKTNDSFADLAAKEAQDKMQRAGVVMSAQNTMIDQGDKVWQDRLRQLQARLGIRAVGTQNTFNALQGIGGSLSMAGGMFGAGGGTGAGGSAGH